MKEYAFDVVLHAAIRVKAENVQQAIALLKGTLDSAESNFGAWPDGTPVLGEASLHDKPELYEIDGEEAVICRDCGAIEGEPEWGTGGDGFDGYCPSCADKREVKWHMRSTEDDEDFWNEDDGWGPFSARTIYNGHEKEHTALSLNSEWVREDGEHD